MTLTGMRQQAAPASMIRGLDWILVAAVLALTAVSSLLVYSATKPKQIAVGGDPEAFLTKHLLFLVLGLGLCLFVALSDHRLMRAYTPLVYLISIAGLVAVLSPLGSTINGSHSWIKLPGGFSIQPSEFAKVAVVLSLAMILGERRDREAEPERSDLLLALGVAGVPMALVMLQPDLGTTVVIGSIALGMLAIAGTPLRWMLGLLGAGGLAVVAVVAIGVLDQYQVDRFAAFADPNADPRGVGYNVNQARIAIGAGGLTGTGLFQGSQTNGRFVPEQQTDFVFTVAGEELGFLGAGLIIALLGVVLWRAMRIAANAGDLFGRLAAVGVASWFAFQSFENIGMNLGIMPVTGVPLPFVSYGGSSMLANMMAIGLLLNVHLRHNR